MNEPVLKALTGLTDIRTIVFTDRSTIICEIVAENANSLVIANPVRLIGTDQLMSYCVRSTNHVQINRQYVLAMAHSGSTVKEHYVLHVIEKVY